MFSELEQGVYIFGHSHIQWSYQSKDGKTVLINPGSCGLPLDGITGSVPYTILDISDVGNIVIEEKRIPFEVSVDSFYSEKNMKYLEKVITDIETGRANLVEHDLLED